MTETGISPVVIENETGTSPVIIIVDHASNHIPSPWGTLGLDAEALNEHIAWDPGALPVARAMSRLMDAPLIHASVSRLILDLNRPLSSSTLIPAISETTAIPGNQSITAEDRAQRIARVYEPYHAAVAGLVERHAARVGGSIGLAAIHTFTPIYKGVARPLEVGILFDKDERLGAGVLELLKAEPGLKAEANQPYAPSDEVYTTLDRHAVRHGHLNVMIEIRNDLLRTEDAQSDWAKRLADAISRTMATLGNEGRASRQKTG